MRHSVERHGEGFSSGVRYHCEFQFVVGGTLACDRQFYVSDRSNGLLNTETGEGTRVNADLKYTRGALALLHGCRGYTGVGGYGLRVAVL